MYDGVAPVLLKSLIFVFRFYAIHSYQILLTYRPFLLVFFFLIVEKMLNPVRLANSKVIGDQTFWSRTVEIGPERSREFMYVQNWEKRK